MVSLFHWSRKHVPRNNHKRFQRLPAAPPREPHRARRRGRKTHLAYSEMDRPNYAAQSAQGLKRTILCPAEQFPRTAPARTSSDASRTVRWPSLLRAPGVRRRRNAPSMNRDSDREFDQTYRRCSSRQSSVRAPENDDLRHTSRSSSSTAQAGRARASFRRSCRSVPFPRRLERQNSVPVLHVNQIVQTLQLVPNVHEHGQNRCVEIEYSIFVGMNNPTYVFFPTV